MKPNQREEGWVCVFEAPDEWRAEIVRGWLMEDGIPVVVQSHMVPGYANVMLPTTGHWGDVLVPRTCERDARDLIASMLDGE